MAKFAEADKQTDEKIEKLARIVQQGFGEMSDKFEETAKKSEVDERFNNLENKMNDMGNKVNQIDRRLFSLEEDIADMKLKKYKDLPERVSLLEKKLTTAK